MVGHLRHNFGEDKTADRRKRQRAPEFKVDDWELRDAVGVVEEGAPRVAEGLELSSGETGELC